jgi:benzil reductase ((S)-benzoin forming)
MSSRLFVLTGASRGLGAAMAEQLLAADHQLLCLQLRAADPAGFADQGNFVKLKDGGLLTSPTDAAPRVQAYLRRSDFGTNPVADVRDA